MSYGSSGHHGLPPTRPRPSRTPTTPPPHLEQDNEYFSPRRNSGAFDGLNKRARRGKSPHDIMREGAISSEERSLEFDGIPIDEKEIGKLPRKLRGYYEHLALIHQHYLEVDSLLSGELPANIVSSFAGRKRDSGQHWADLDNHSHSRGRIPEGEEGGGDDERPYWERHTSAWKIKKKRASIDHILGEDNGITNLNEEEQEIGEGTRLLSEDIDQRDARRERIARLALNINTIVNIILVAAKAVAVLYSASISLTASLVDSALDLLSTFIILGTSWAIGVQTDKHMYPAGKRRFEPLGVLIFSVAMIASFVQVFIESLQRATSKGKQEVVDLSGIGIATMLVTIGVKGILWVWCSRIPSSGVQALAQDAENDVFFNIMSLAFPYLGTLLKWKLLDPIGGMVLSTYIIVEWIKTLLENFAKLSGKTASSDQITRVLYLVQRFNPILEIADVECYHIGDDLIVEIDVILPRSSTLHFAHDIGETIQCMLESLDGVIRAYVHTDYSSYNPPQHTSRKQRQPSTSSKLAITLTPSRSRVSEPDDTSTGSITPTNKRPVTER